MQLSFKNGTRRHRHRTLADLHDGEEALVDRIDLPSDFATRLMELGFVPGHTVLAAHAAPGGDPRVFRVDGTEIALRRETARHIFLHETATRTK
jgi:Fe2+ transport system protein FeoA